MRLLSACVLAVTGSCAAQADTGPSDIVEQFHQSLERGDAPAALAALSDDIKIFEQGWVEQSKAEYAAHHLASDIEFSKAVKSSTTSVDVTVDGTLAYVLRQGTTVGMFEGKPVNSIGIETMVLQKAGSGWKIVHIHWSSRKSTP